MGRGLVRLAPSPLRDQLHHLARPARGEPARPGARCGSLALAPGSRPAGAGAAGVPGLRGGRGGTVVEGRAPDDAGAPSDQGALPSDLDVFERLDTEADLSWRPDATGPADLSEPADAIGATDLSEPTDLSAPADVPAPEDQGGAQDPDLADGHRPELDSGPRPTCGDGRREGSEACDDGNTVDGDYCAAGCDAVTGRCGDGQRQDNEACDDGNTVDGDHCAAGCGAVTGRCGDGQRQDNEACDDGNDVDVDLCSNGCDRARPAPSPITAAFAFPTPEGGEDATLQDEVLRLITMAAPGSQVRVSMYEWSRVVFADALGDAADRGADVRVVLDRTHPSAAVVQRLQQRLGPDRVHPCPHPTGSACIGDGINHNKILLLSALTDGSTQVVVQSSGNFNRGQVSRHNNLVAIRGDATLYAFYLDYWDDLRAARRDLDYYRSQVGASGTKAYLFPRASGDTAVSILGNVHCDPGARVRVAMAFFTDARLEVAQALARLQERGCDVRAVIGDYDSSPGDDVVATLRRAGVPLRVAPREDRNVHSKVLLIDARYGEGDAIERLVFTGSHNWTGPALRRNDEALLKLREPEVFAAFWQNWEGIWAQMQ